MWPYEDPDVLQMGQPAGANAPDPLHHQLGLRRTVIEERRARVHHERAVVGQPDVGAERRAVA